MSVAVVDISKKDQATADALVEAASTMGFVFVEGSDFSKADVENIFKLSAGFFEQSAEEKKEKPIDETNYGYSRINLEVLDPEHQPDGDPKEAFNFGSFVNHQPQNEMPKYFKTHIDEVTELEEKCHSLALQLLELLAMGLKIDESKGGKEWFTSRHIASKRSGSTLRFLYYPGQKKENPEEQIRAGAHTDYGTLTLLFQKQGEDGLEILSPVSKKWTPVNFVPPTKDGAAPPIIVNIADLMSFWTAGVLKSAIHRVKFPKEAQESGKDRYSVVYFCHPNNEVTLDPVPSEIVSKVVGRGANIQSGEAITAEEHLRKRLAATYQWKKPIALT